MNCRKRFWVGTVKRDRATTEERFLISAASFTTLLEGQNSFPSDTQLYQVGTSKEVLIRGERNIRPKAGATTGRAHQSELSEVTIDNESKTPFPNRIRKSHLEKQVDRIALIGRLESFRPQQVHGSLGSTLIQRCKSISTSMPRIILRVVRVFKTQKSGLENNEIETLDDIESMVCTLDYITPWDAANDLSPRPTFLLENTSEHGMICHLQSICNRISSCLHKKR